MVKRKFHSVSWLGSFLYFYFTYEDSNELRKVVVPANLYSIVLSEKINYQKFCFIESFSHTKSNIKYLYRFKQRSRFWHLRDKKKFLKEAKR